MILYKEILEIPSTFLIEKNTFENDYLSWIERKKVIAQPGEQELTKL